MPSLNRSYALAAFAVLSGVTAVFGAYLFLLNIPDPPAGSDGFAHGLAGGGAILYGLAGFVVVGVGVALAALEAFDAGTPYHRLVAQVGAGLAGAGPPLVFVWVHLDGPVELTGVAFVCIVVGTLFVGLVSGWVSATTVIRTLRSG
ncbi:hypothetical protein [Haloprofundus halobius]|uniref:hypothetical protein n=1 Tax=Haloprofundus halobius TaxID=2876194 RepID=UPI001CCC41F4|nr:hypothetical protein [Haloprofundus halobius]